MPLRPLVLVPTGSTEQHGPHLPLDTDSVIAEAVALAVAAELREEGTAAVVAPALAYGASGEHQGFAGTVSIGHEALSLVLFELVRSMAAWAGRIVFVNGHGGNLPTLAIATAILADEGHDVDCVSCEVPGDAHAGRSETSLMLELRPGSVRLGAARPGNTTPLADLMPALISEGVRALSPSGVLGDPTGASEEEGGELFRALVARVRHQVQGGGDDEPAP